MTFFSVFKPEELELLLDRSDLTWKAQKKLMEAKEKEEGSRKKKARLDAKKKTINTDTSGYSPKHKYAFKFSATFAIKKAAQNKQKFAQSRANPKTAIYASAVKFCDTTNSLVRFESK
jgi:hypothetical protein